MAGKKKKELTVIVRPDGKIPAAAYLRVSSSGQDVENSIDAQLEHIRRWAENNGYVIVKVFTDRAKTGRFANRPDFQEMIETAESNNCPFSAVLVWRFSRFFRDRLESATYKQRLRKKNVRVISINEPTDDTPEGHLLEGMLEVVDQHHSDMTAVDVQRGTHNLAQRGFFVGARPPMGMKRIKVPDARGEKVTERNKLAPDEENAWIIRRVFDLSLQEKTDGQIHKILRAEGLVMPSGKPWYPNRIHDILTNRHYEGTIVWGAQPDGTWTTVCEKAHEGIVTPAEFTEVSRLRKERSPKVTHPRYAGSEHMLSQLGTCKQCGQPYTYRASVDSYLYIMCKTRRHFGEAFCDSPILPAALFEAMTLDVVDNDILLRHNLELAMDQLRENSGTLHTDKAKRAEKIRKSVADYDRRIENAYLAWENEDIGYEFFTKRTEELRNLKATAMEELQKLEEDLDDTYVILNNPEAMLDYSAKLKTFLRDEQPTSARRWLRTFLKRFWIEKGYVTYEYRLPLPPDSTNGGLKKHTVPLDFDPITRSGPGERGTGCHPQRGHHRQPEREDHGKRGPRGYDAGKKVSGRKRHIVVDTTGLLLAVVVHAASIQDRDGAKLVNRFPRLQVIWADAAYTGRLVAWALATGGWLLSVVRRNPDSHRFEVLPRRWVVERTLAWLSRCRRLSKDYEELPETGEAWVHIAMVHLMLKRLKPT